MIRLGLRAMVKPRLRAASCAQDVRGLLNRLGPLVPLPAPGTVTIPIDAGGVRAERIITGTSHPDRHVIYLHGGGYVSGSPGFYRNVTSLLASMCRACVLCIDYRLAPEHPLPAALDDAVAAYRWLLAQGADPRRIAIIGDSAGGGLAFATMLRARDEGVVLPAAAAVVSPWTDLALTGESLRLNAAIDPVISTEFAALAVNLCLAGGNPRNPYLSPLYGDPAGLSPTLILVGSDDVLRDDAVRMADKMRAAGCRVEVEVWPGMWHAWHLTARVTPEADAAIARIAKFMQDKL